MAPLFRTGVPGLCLWLSLLHRTAVEPHLQIFRETWKETRYRVLVLHPKGQLLPPHHDVGRAGGQHIDERAIDPGLDHVAGCGPAGDAVALDDEAAAVELGLGPERRLVSLGDE